ncbi:MAG: hypothetical protein ACREBS_05090 [Nitrososphaerales archaeon]
MVSDSDMGAEGENTEEQEEKSTAGEEVSYGAGHAEETSQEEEAGAGQPTERPKQRSSGRRAALRILRENVDGVSKDLTSFRKNHEVSAKKLEKQVSSLRSEVASLKSFISKESARARSKEEAYLNRILSKLNTPKAKSKPKKKAAKKSKGKK